MKNKKKEINLSIILFLFTAAASFLFWYFKEKYPAFEFLFALTSGICGSSFATLCIFISNYRAEKERLFRTIFEEGMFISGQLPFFNEIKVPRGEMEEYLLDREYLPPLAAKTIEQMSPKERNFYNACRYIDSFLDLGYERLLKFWNDINEIDFWTDPVQLPDSFASSRLLRKLWNKNYLAIRKSKGFQIRERFRPFFYILMSPSVADEKYIFYSFSDFRDRKQRKALDIYDLILKLNSSISGPHDVEEWKKAEDKGLRWYLYTTLVTFHDAFCSSGSYKKEALKALITGEKYAHIR